jgi:hypothetical protein
VDWDGPIHGARPSGRQQVPRSAAHARSHGGTARVGATPTHVGCSPRVVVVPLGLGRRRLGAARCEKAMARASERSAAQRNVVVAATVSAEHVKSSCPRGTPPLLWRPTLPMPVSGAFCFGAPNNSWVGVDVDPRISSKVDQELKNPLPRRFRIYASLQRVLTS